MKTSLNEWFRGYVLLEIHGNGCCRFVHLCANKGLTINQMDCINADFIRVRMSINDFWKVRPIRKKTRVHIQILKKKGYPFVAKKYHLRLIFLFLFMAVVSFFILRNCFIWSIKVTGNSQLSDETIIRYLQQKDAGYLSCKSDLKLSDIENSIRTDFPSVMWVSVSLDDACLLVQIRENSYPDKELYEEKEQQKGYDLIAKKDATIISMVTRQGAPCVKVLDQVKEGDILVSALQPIYDDNEEICKYYISKADADIIGLVTYDYADEIPKTRLYMGETDRTIKNLFLYVYGQKINIPIPLCLYQNHTQTTEYFYFPWIKYKKLPIGIGINTKFERKEKILQISQKQAQKLADDNLSEFIFNLKENGVLIISKNVIMEEYENSYKVSGVIYAKESIGIPSPKEDIPVDEHE